MSHPLDLHPLHEIAQRAWSVIKQAGQPEYTDLPVDYRSKLLRHADKVKVGEFAEDDGPIGAFEQEVNGLLNEAMLKPEVKEELVEEAVEEAEEPEEVETAEPLEPKGHLPESFPALDKLHEAGINTYGQLAKAEDLTEIEGIGPAIAKKIEKRVKADKKALNK